LVHTCGTVECVIKSFLAGKDAELGGTRYYKVESREGSLSAYGKLLATREEDRVVIHPPNYFPGDAVLPLYGKVVSIALNRTALSEYLGGMCVPRLRIYWGSNEVVDLSITQPIVVDTASQEVYGLELSPEVSAVRHHIARWVLGEGKALEVFEAATAHGIEMSVMRAEVDGRTVLRRLSIEGEPVGTFYAYERRSGVWVGVVSRGVKYGFTNIVADCAEAVRSFGEVCVDEDVVSILEEFLSNPLVMQVYDELTR